MAYTEPRTVLILQFSLAVLDRSFNMHKYDVLIWFYLFIYAANHLWFRLECMFPLVCVVGFYSRFMRRLQVNLL